MRLWGGHPAGGPPGRQPAPCPPARTRYESVHFWLFSHVTATVSPSGAGPGAILQREHAVGLGQSQRRASSVHHHRVARRHRFAHGYLHQRCELRRQLLKPDTADGQQGQLHRYAHGQPNFLQSSSDRHVHGHSYLRPPRGPAQFSSWTEPGKSASNRSTTASQCSRPPVSRLGTTR